MNRISIATLASLALLVGCAKNNKGTENPDDVTDNGADDSSGVDDSADKAAARRPSPVMGSGTRSGATRVGKHRSLVAKKPPVTTDTKPNKRPKTDYKPSDPVLVAGAVPTVLVSGGVFNVYGEAFHDDVAKNKVYIGGTPQKVLELAGDHLLVEAVGPATGTLRVSKSGSKRLRGRIAGKSKTANTYAVLAAGSGFAAPAVTAGHGLLGTLYDVGAASTEMPDFNSVGDPVGYLLMENLDVAPGTFAGFPAGEKTLKENFGIHFQGSLNVVDSGDYELCLEAGDGALLFLNGEPLLDNDGAGETRKVCDTLEIEAGEYDLQLLYYQNDGDLALRLTWARDGGAAETIPATAFFPPENLDGLAASLNQ